jgi:hypothetical protein
MKQALLFLISFLSLSLPNTASALDCIPADFTLQAKSKNVLVGRITEVTINDSVEKDERPQKDYQVKILKKLKSSELFPEGKDEFVFAANQGWDYFEYKKGQIIMFFFKDSISVTCNFPIVIE